MVEVSEVFDAKLKLESEWDALTLKMNLTSSSVKKGFGSLQAVRYTPPLDSIHSVCVSVTAL
jgi:hypothetical protein